MTVPAQDVRTGRDHIYCPACGSQHLRKVPRKGYRMRSLLAAGAALIGLAHPAEGYCWEYVCRSCGTRFVRPARRKEDAA